MSIISPPLGPSYIQAWRNDTYPSINPARPELSHAGKTIVITGASTGIGKAIAESYAVAGAARIVILARREPLLKQVKADLEAKFPSTSISYHVADVTDRSALDKAAKKIGSWDVLVLNAGYLPEVGPMATAKAEEWWKGYEINVLGVFFTIQAFYPTKPKNAIYVAVSSAVIAIPGAGMANGTSYQSSKMAVTKLLETFSYENPDDRVHILHPGVIATDMMAKSGMQLPMDTEKLPADFIVWTSSPEGAFTSGKMTYANWDVDALVSKKDEFTTTPVQTTGFVGWPYAVAA